MAVDDVGKVINPLIVEGQVHGGVAQGIAQALFEEAVYDESGNLITGSFAEYLLPSSADLPDIITDRTETPATTHPLGVKGVGEAGTIASTPAVVNAIVDALRPRGVTTSRCRCTPERVWRAAQAGRWSHDPGRVRLHPTVHGGGRGDRALADAAATRPRCWPAGRACCRCCGCASPHRRCWSTWAGSPQLRGIRVDGDALVDRRDDHPRRGGRVAIGAGRGAAVATMAAATVGDRAGTPPRHARRLARPRRPGR